LAAAFAVVAPADRLWLTLLLLLPQRPRLLHCASSRCLLRMAQKKTALKSRV
jgi:hypothetical protein